MDTANNLTALRALPENQVIMAAGLLGLLRSIAGTMGPAFAAVFWDQRYSYHIQQYAARTPMDAQGLTAALGEVQHFLLWTGEIAAQIPTKTLSLVHQRLLAEASTELGGRVTAEAALPGLAEWARPKPASNSLPI